MNSKQTASWYFIYSQLCVYQQTRITDSIANNYINKFFTHIREIKLLFLHFYYFFSVLFHFSFCVWFPCIHFQLHKSQTIFHFHIEFIFHSSFPLQIIPPSAWLLLYFCSFCSFFFCIQSSF